MTNRVSNHDRLAAARALRRGPRTRSLLNKIAAALKPDSLGEQEEIKQAVARVAVAMIEQLVSEHPELLSMPRKKRAKAIERILRGID